jgi:2-keto-4-pentenoate hydratase
MTAAGIATQATDETIAAVADRIHRAGEQRVPVPPVRHELGGIADAYRAQRSLRALWAADGRRPIGYKIGATSRAVRDEFGLSEPDYGAIYADTAYTDGTEVACDRFISSRIEPEIAFVLERDLDLGTHTAVDLIRATAFVLPAMEIADCRIQNWDVTIVDSIADNASAGGIVLGSVPVPLDRVDLRSCPVAMEIDEKVVASGRGDACMGNPIAAMLWLADTLSRDGSPLRAGDVVLTGALAPVQPLRPGNSVRTTLGPLGTVQIFAV